MQRKQKEKDFMPELACEIADHELEVTALIAHNNTNDAFGRPANREPNWAREGNDRVRNHDTLVSQLCSLREILEDSLAADPYGLSPQEVEACVAQVMRVVVRSRAKPSTEGEFLKLYESACK